MTKMMFLHRFDSSESRCFCNIVTSLTSYTIRLTRATVLSNRCN